MNNLFKIIKYWLYSYMHSQKEIDAVMKLQCFYKKRLYLKRCKMTQTIITMIDQEIRVEESQATWFY